MKTIIRDYKGLLTSFVEVVVFLLASFGGFLRTIAPPQQTGASYAVGILSFFVLIVLLIISGLARSSPGGRYRRGWLLAGAAAFVSAIPACFLYPGILDKYTWYYPPDKPVQRLRGLDNDFTPEVKRFIEQNHGQTDPKILAQNFELGDIWSAESLRVAGTKLLIVYVWLVLSLATAIFCLLEANTLVR